MHRLLGSGTSIAISRGGYQSERSIVAIAKLVHSLAGAVGISHGGGWDSDAWVVSSVSRSLERASFLSFSIVLAHADSSSPEAGLGVELCAVRDQQHHDRREATGGVSLTAIGGERYMKRKASAMRAGEPAADVRDGYSYPKR